MGSIAGTRWRAVELRSTRHGPPRAPSFRLACTRSKRGRRSSARSDRARPAITSSASSLSAFCRLGERRPYRLQLPIQRRSKTTTSWKYTRLPTLPTYRSRREAIEGWSASTYSVGTYGLRRLWTRKGLEALRQSLFLRVVTKCLRATGSRVTAGILAVRSGHHGNIMPDATFPGSSLYIAPLIRFIGEQESSMREGGVRKAFPRRDAYGYDCPS